MLAVASLGDVVYDQGGDSVRYLSIARDILEGRPYGITAGDATRVPLYQLFLAGHLWIFRDWLKSVALTQAVIGAATAVVLMWTVRDVSGDRRSWFVGLLWAMYPPAILNTVVLFPHTLQVFWLVTAFWLVVRGTLRRSLVLCAAAGVCWDVSCLTRSGNLLFLPIFALAPLLFSWQRTGPSRRWATAGTAVIFAAGAVSVGWWTARDFTKTYRLEHLLLNGHERHAVMILLRPLEPVHGRVANALLRRAEQGRTATAARLLDAEFRQSDLNELFANWRRERSRLGTKKLMHTTLMQSLGAPDGTVQLGCTGPLGGYWTAFREQFATDPLGIARVTISRPCMVLKSVMYAQHYLLLALVVPSLVLLARWAPGLAMLLFLFGAFTGVGIVFATNYSETVAAVPRYAFTLMPVAILLVGLWPLTSDSRERRADALLS